MTAPKLVLIESSGRVGRVGLSLGTDVIASRELSSARRRACDLTPALGELFAEHNWAPSDVVGIIVSRGPGSYTGLRVGITTAKVFAYATGCKLVALDTFHIIAAVAAKAEIANVEVIADAQPPRLYAQRFTDGTAGPLRIESTDEWLGQIGDVSVSGSGVDLIAKRLPATVTVVESELREPTLEMMAVLGLLWLHCGRSVDVWNVEPLYGRKSSAEEKLSLSQEKNEPRP